MSTPPVRFDRSGDVDVAYQIAGSGLQLAYRGAHALKGIPGEWQVFAVA
jgi:hypothetical protein